MTVDAEFVAACLKPFADNVIGYKPTIWCKACSDARGTCKDHNKRRCPKCGQNITEAHNDLSFVGHAPLTARLLELDPEWSWEPVAWTPEGEPLVKSDGKNYSMWIKLTIRGVTRLGVGTCEDSTIKKEYLKELVGDALRNAGMRFGLALDLWAKGDLIEDQVPEGQTAPETPPQPRQAAPKPPPSPRAPRPAAAPSGAPSAPAEDDRPQEWLRRAQAAWKRVPEEHRQEAIAHLMGESVADPETGEALAIWPMPTLKVLQEKRRVGSLAVIALEEAIAIFLLGVNEMVDS